MDRRDEGMAHDPEGLTHDSLVYRVPAWLCTTAWLGGLQAIIAASPGDTPFHLILQGEKGGETPLKLGDGYCVNIEDQRLMERLMVWREGGMS